ncbi:hypothetical protein BGZ93_007892 [Podila epicladia]|nr:hypothetical protein BGZ92_009074 [Podila epicladia]KAG0099396.1 hypothetical protein BGZ93_007892 [Podila epicladia]
MTFTFKHLPLVMHADDPFISSQDNGIPLEDASGVSDQPTTPISFPDLLFDSVLMQQSRTKGELNQQSEGLARIDMSYIVEAFKIALSTCSTDQAVTKIRTAGTVVKALDDSKLDQIDHVRNYVIQRKGSNGIFPKDQILIPHEKDLGHFLIPTANSTTTTFFEDAYTKADRKDMEMVALIMYQIRTQLDAVIIETKDLDRKLGLAVYSFCPRYFGQRAYNKQKESLPESFPTKESKIQAAIDQFTLDMKELQIADCNTAKPTYGLQGQLDVPLALASDMAIDAVTAAVDVLFKAQVPSERYIAQRANLIERLQRILDSAFPGYRLRIEEFGSYASGLGSDISDADLCITSDNFDRSAPYGSLENMTAALRRGGMTRLVPLIQARIPIITFVDPISKIDCDINCNGLHGVHGSRLIKFYTMIDPRMRPLVYSVKALVKAHGINNARVGYFSTFAYMLMIIGFLQAQDPPILPSLQNQPKERLTELFVQSPEETSSNNEIDCSFDQDIDRYRNFGAANTKPVGQLLIEFFEFYCRYFDYQSVEVNVRLGGFRIRDEVSQKRAMGHKPLATGQGEKKMYVVDPFTDRNTTGKCSAQRLTQIWRTFQWLYYQLSQGRYQQAFAPIPRSYFRFEVQLMEHVQTQASNAR